MARFWDNTAASDMLSQQPGDAETSTNSTACKFLPIDISQTQAETYVKEYFEVRNHGENGSPVKIEVLFCRSLRPYRRHHPNIYCVTRLLIIWRLCRSTIQASYKALKMLTRSGQAADREKQRVLMLV